MKIRSHSRVKMGNRREEERLEMSNGNGHEGERRGTPAASAAPDRPELVGKGKGTDFSHLSKPFLT